MTCEEEVVLRCDGHRVAHECRRVDGQGSCEGSGDAELMSAREAFQFEHIVAQFLCLEELKCPEESGNRGHLGTYISGSFFMSAMAAKGMPKLDAGPQKSASREHSQQCVLVLSSHLWSFNAMFED
jgi:hypothetical protein